MHKARSRGPMGNTTGLSRRLPRSINGERIIRPMNPTYADIAECVKQRHGFVPKTCWIAHVKEPNGWPMGTAPNRLSQTPRLVPCPPDKRAAIESCFRRLSSFRKKPKVKCPHCGMQHEFTFTKGRKRSLACNQKALPMRLRSQIMAHLCARRLITGFGRAQLSTK